MIVEAPAKYLNCENNSFTDQETGRLVEYARIQVLDYPDYQPVTLSINKDVVGGGLPFDKLQDIILTITIVPARNGVRVRVENVRASK